MSHRARALPVLLAVAAAVHSGSAGAAGLSAAISFSRSILTSGQMVAVALTVTCTGNDVTGAVPGLSPFLGGGLAALASGPVPSGTALMVAGTKAVFGWSFSTSGSGVVGFSGTVTGWDVDFAVTVAGAASGSVVIQAPPAMSASLVVSPAAVLPGDAIIVVYTVSNSGEAGATVTPVAPRVSGSGTCYMALVSSSTFVAGGGRASFTWVYTAGPSTASLSFSASGSGRDANTGGWVACPVATAGPVTVTPPTGACGASPSLVSRYDGRSTFYDQGHAIAVSQSGSVFIAGEEDMSSFSRMLDCATIGYPPGGGGLFWLGDFGSAGSVADAAYGVALGPDGSVYSVGHAGNTAWIEKWTPPPGVMEWFLLPVAGPGGPDELRAVAVDPAGDIVVAGKQRRTDLGHGDDAWVAKYHPDNSLAWSVNYDSPASSDEAAFAVAVDLSGSIFVAGYETRNDLGQGRNIVVLKYDPAGNLLWSRSYAGPGGGHDQGHALALDLAGNIHVAGFETRGDLGQGENGWVRKYGPGGAVLWTAGFNSPMTRAGGPNDRAFGIAVDAVNGDVFVTGRTERPGKGADVLFARWNSAGKLQDLEARNGPNSGNDEGHAVTTGPGGDLYVTGYEDWDQLALRTDMTVYRWPRPGCLKAALSVSPVPVSSGSTIEVVLTVTNTGGFGEAGVTPVLVAAPGAGLLSPVSSPAPLANLAAGASAFFTWVFATSGTGVVGLTVTVTGTDLGTSQTMSAWASAGTEVIASASLVGAISLPPSSCPGAAFPVEITVTNTGLGPAWLGVVVILGDGSRISGPVPALPLTVAGGASVTLSWSWSASGPAVVSFSATVSGVDLTGGMAISDGPLALGLTVSGRAVLVAAAAAPVSVALGAGFTVEITVTNTGSADATGVGPALAVSLPGLATLSGPSPGGPVPIPSGGSVTFAWTCSATSWGSLVFSLTAAGSDSCGPVAVQAAVPVQAGGAAVLTGSVVSVAPVSLCTGDWVSVVVSVTNTGDIPALSVRGRPMLAVAGGAAAQMLAFPPPVASLAGGASAHFAWTYSAAGAGSAWFTATVSGIDAASGATVYAAPLVSPPVTMTSPAALSALVEMPSAALAGSWVTATVWVTNAGDENAVGVTATAFAGPGGSWIAGAAGPATVPPGPAQAFTWTWSVGGTGTVVFSYTVAGTTCGGRPVRAASSAALAISLPAILVVDSLMLAPGSPVANSTVVARMVLRNAGGIALSVDGLSRTVSGTGGLGASTAFVPSLPVPLAPGATLLVSWSHAVSAPCGPASVAASAAGAESGSGRPLWSGTVVSNQVSVTGTATGLTLTASAAKATVGSQVTLTAVVTDNCGQPVGGAVVAFTVVSGGGSLSVAGGFTDFSGRVSVRLTLGVDEGLNGVTASAGGGTLSASASVQGVNPLVLTEPGAALDRNVLVLGTGQIVLARIYPRDDSPIVTRIFTASGRLVRTLRRLTPFGRGQFIVEWDGKSEDEFPVARGVYIVQVKGGGLHEKLKVLVK